MEPETYAATRQEWREWLMRNQTGIQAVWLVYYKLHTGKPSVSYRESLEEALCFGWIDGIRRRIDEERYASRFTPRRQGSNWSDFNINLARKLPAEGRMTETGLAVFNQGMEAGKKESGSSRAVDLSLTPELEKPLREHPDAWNNFLNLAASYRRQYILWLLDAKRPETRSKRLEEAIRLLSANQKLGMK